MLCSDVELPTRVDRHFPSKTIRQVVIYVRLSANVLHDPGAAIALAGINARERAKAWGEWLCFAPTVGDRFEIRNGSHSEGFTYDLVIFGISPEDARRLASADLARLPQATENASWQPVKRLPPSAEPRPRVCQPGDLAIGDIARKEDGREYIEKPAPRFFSDY